MRPHAFPAFAAALIGSIAPLALASPPTALYLVPGTYNAKVRDTLQLSLKRGLGGGDPIEQSIAFDSIPSDWFFFRVAATQENRDSPLLMNEGANPAPPLPQPAPVAPPAPAKPAEQPPAVTPAKPPVPVDPPNNAGNNADNKNNPPAPTNTISFQLVTRGVAMTGCDFTPRVERIPATELLAFLKASLTTQAYDELALSLPAQGDVRVRRIETVKTLLRIDAVPLSGEQGDPVVLPDTQTATTKVGQVNEIRFSFDPTNTPIGSDVAFRVFANYDKAAKARVTVACDEAKFSQQIESDGSGTAKFTLAHAGAWRVEFHHAKALKDDPDADLVLSSATVTFHTTKEAAR